MERSEIPVVVIGAGGHGSEVYTYILDLVRGGEQLRFVGFVDDTKPIGPFGDTEILGDLGDLERLSQRFPGLRYITAVGDNRLRAELVQKVGRSRNLRAWSLRHHSSNIGHDVSFGEGTCLAPGAIVTTRVRIGSHCILNVHSSVSHDCVVGDYANINPGAVIAGNVRIGEGAYIGAGATVIEKVSIGEWSIVGAGAVVTMNIPPHTTAVGVPARVIKEHKPLS